MPIPRRKWYVQRLLEQQEFERDQIDQARRNQRGGQAMMGGGAPAQP